MVMLFIGIALAFPYFFEEAPSLFKQPKDAFHTFLGAAVGFYILIYPGLKDKMIQKEKSFGRNDMDDL
ncbi:hypothetical protein [Neolewinella lacunae]|nr:hypothetical protein [Neolewinella lacunae]